MFGQFVAIIFKTLIRSSVVFICTQLLFYMLVSITNRTVLCFANVDISVTCITSFDAVDICLVLVCLTSG